MRKANLKVKDEFHDRLTTGDIDHLRWARAYLVITPLTMMGLFHFMNRMRQEGGFSQHFRNFVSKAKNSYSSKNQATWEKASSGYKSKQENPSAESTTVKDIYKEAIKER